MTDELLKIMDDFCRRTAKRRKNQTMPFIAESSVEVVAMVTKATDRIRELEARNKTLEEGIQWSPIGQLNVGDAIECGWILLAVGTNAAGQPWAGTCVVQRTNDLGDYEFVALYNGHPAFVNTSETTVRPTAFYLVAPCFRRAAATLKYEVR